METFLIKAAQLILSLSILVVLHELGHFIPAKIFKTRVEKFFLFFDVKFALFKKKIGETVYGIGWLPLGGYVKIAGMIDESMDKEQMAQPPQPWEFRSKPAWQRLIIMVGGVTVNLLLGFFIYAMILFVWGERQVKADGLPDGFSPSPIMQSYGFKNGDIVTKVNGKPLENILDINKYLLLRDVSNLTVQNADGSTRSISLPDSIGMQLFHAGEMTALSPRFPAVIDSVINGSAAAKAGLQKGDKILSAGDTPTDFYDEFVTTIQQTKAGDTLPMMVKRGEERIALAIVPEVKDGRKIIGIYTATAASNIKITEKKYSLGAAFANGISYGYDVLRDYVSQFKFVFTKKGATQVGGFGTIGKLFPAQWDWLSFWHATAFISIILAFMNILPIPALDGGHVVFLLYEIVTGRKPSEKVLEVAQMVGFVILIAILLYANGNDLYRAIFK